MVPEVWGMSFSLIFFTFMLECLKLFSDHFLEFLMVITMRNFQGQLSMFVKLHIA